MARRITPRAIGQFWGRDTDDVCDTMTRGITPRAYGRYQSSSLRYRPGQNQQYRATFSSNMW